MRKLLSILLICLMCLSLGSCSYLGSKWHDFKGEIKGNEYIIDTFDNSGNLLATIHGENIKISGNISKSENIDPNSESNYNYELSSVISITIDGKDMESCGDTLVFYDKRLTPDVAFDPDFSFNSSSDGLLDWTIVAGRVNEIKNKFGKGRIVLIKSQLGNPIYAFSGDDVYWELPENLPKFTKLMIDGKAMYIHRANFQIIDKELLD